MQCCKHNKYVRLRICRDSNPHLQEHIDPKHHDTPRTFHHHLCIPTSHVDSRGLLEVLPPLLGSTALDWAESRQAEWRAPGVEDGAANAQGRAALAVMLPQAEPGYQLALQPHLRVVFHPTADTDNFSTGLDRDSKTQSGQKK